MIVIIYSTLFSSSIVIIIIIISVRTFQRKFRFGRRLPIKTERLAKNVGLELRDIGLPSNNLWRQRTTYTINTHRATTPYFFIIYFINPIWETKWSVPRISISFCFNFMGLHLIMIKVVPQMAFLGRTRVCVCEIWKEDPSHPFPSGIIKERQKHALPTNDAVVLFFNTACFHHQTPNKKEIGFTPRNASFPSERK